MAEIVNSFKLDPDELEVLIVLTASYRKDPNTLTIAEARDLLFNHRKSKDLYSEAMILGMQHMYIGMCKREDPLARKYQAEMEKKIMELTRELLIHQNKMMDRITTKLKLQQNKERYEGVGN